MKFLKKNWLHKRGKLIGMSAAVVIAVVYIFVFSPHTTTAACSQAPAVRMVPQNFTQLAKNCGPAVVNISTVKTLTSGGGRVFEQFFGGRQNPHSPFSRFFDDFFRNQPQREFKQKSLGSGFILDKEGYIVTNNHVIAGADEIQVKLKDGKEYPAEIIGSDASTDLALIKIKVDHDLSILNMGDSDTLEIGQWVLAIGSPFGLEQTVTAGIISAKGRVIGAGSYDDFIQTDASINPGNSGGPLLNMNGEVVGINTAIVANGQGIGFAIPVSMAQGIVKQLQAHGSVTRGWLGVSIQDLTPELAEYYGIKDKKGILVAQVFEGDPADKAGIKLGKRETGTCIAQRAQAAIGGAKAECLIINRAKITAMGTQPRERCHIAKGHIPGQRRSAGPEIKHPLPAIRIGRLLHHDALHLRAGNDRSVGIGIRVKHGRREQGRLQVVDAVGKLDSKAEQQERNNDENRRNDPGPFAGTVFEHMPGNRRFAHFGRHSHI